MTFSSELTPRVHFPEMPHNHSKRKFLILLMFFCSMIAVAPSQDSAPDSTNEHSEVDCSKLSSLATKFQIEVIGETRHNSNPSSIRKALDNLSEVQKEATEAQDECNVSAIKGANKSLSWVLREILNTQS